MDCQAITLGEHLLGVEAKEFRCKKGDFEVALFYCLTILQVACLVVTAGA